MIARRDEATTGVSPGNQHLRAARRAVAKSLLPRREVAEQQEPLAPAWRGWLIVAWSWSVLLVFAWQMWQQR